MSVGSLFGPWHRISAAARCGRRNPLSGTSGLLCAALVLLQWNTNRSVWRFLDLLSRSSTPASTGLGFCVCRVISHAAPGRHYGAGGEVGGIHAPTVQRAWRTGWRALQRFVTESWKTELAQCSRLSYAKTLHGNYRQRELRQENLSGY